jgi:hypothetical protein
MQKPDISPENISSNELEKKKISPLKSETTEPTSTI